MSGLVRAIGRSLIALAIVATPAYAQEATPDSAGAPGADDRPFVEDGFGDRPYLTNLLGKAAIGGYAEARRPVTSPDKAVFQMVH